MSTSTTATWGSAPSSGESTADPSDECEEFESTFSGDDEFPIGPKRAEEEEPSPEEKYKEVHIPEEDFDEPLQRLIADADVLLAATLLPLRNLPASFCCPLGARSLP